MLSFIENIEKYWKIGLGIIMIIIFFVGAVLSFLDGNYFIAFDSGCLGMIMYFVTRFNAK
jgi:hypothetical protein